MLSAYRLGETKPIRVTTPKSYEYAHAQLLRDKPHLAHAIVIFIKGKNANEQIEAMTHD